MASALGAPEGGLILEDLAEGIRDGERARKSGGGVEVLLADGRCVPRSRYLLRSVARRSGLFGLKLVLTTYSEELCVKCASSTSCRVSFILSSILTVVSPSARYFPVTFVLPSSPRFLGVPVYLFVCPLPLLVRSPRERSRAPRGFNGHDAARCVSLRLRCEREREHERAEWM